MTLGLEICNRYETNVINTARGRLRLADDIGADNVLIHLDTYHMNIEEDDFVRRCCWSATASGTSTSAKTTGATWVRGTWTSRRSSARWTPSPIPGRSPSRASPRRSWHQGLSNDLAIWRNLWTDGFDLAGHARQFIDDGLRDARALARHRHDRWRPDLTRWSLARDAIALHGSRRALLGITGPPGAGKTTLVESLIAGSRPGGGRLGGARPDGRLPPRRRASCAAWGHSTARVPRTHSMRSATRT